VGAGLYTPFSLVAGTAFDTHWQNGLRISGPKGQPRLAYAGLVYQLKHREHTIYIWNDDLSSFVASICSCAQCQLDMAPIHCHHIHILDRRSHTRLPRCHHSPFFSPGLAFYLLSQAFSAEGGCVTSSNPYNRVSSHTQPHTQLSCTLHIVRHVVVKSYEVQPASDESV
jgi:hypothetical protein